MQDHTNNIMDFITLAAKVAKLENEIEQERNEMRRRELLQNLRHEAERKASKERLAEKEAKIKALETNLESRDSETRPKIKRNDQQGESTTEEFYEHYRKRYMKKVETTGDDMPLEEWFEWYRKRRAVKEWDSFVRNVRFGVRWLRKWHASLV